MQIGCLSHGRRGVPDLVLGAMDRPLISLTPSRPTRRFSKASCFRKSQQVASLYDVLGVDSNADKDTIKKAFFKLSKEHHPDVNQDKAEEAADVFRRLAAAYEVLSNPVTRKQYDDERGIRKKATKPVVTYKTATPRHGVGPEFGRKIEVDLSQERMKKAWEAYKRRWQLEEERIRELEEKKLKFRLDLDAARSQGYANMTAEEIVELKEHMRWLRMPGYMMDDCPRRTATNYSSSKGPSGEFSGSWRSRPSPSQPERMNMDADISLKASRRSVHDDDDHGKRGPWDGEDPLLSGLKKDKDNREYIQEYVEESAQRLREQFHNVKRMWDDSQFLSHDDRSSHGSSSRALSIDRVFAAAVVGFVAVIVIAQSMYKTDPTATNRYLIMLREEEERRRKNQTTQNTGASEDRS